VIGTGEPRRHRSRVVVVLVGIVVGAVAVVAVVAAGMRMSAAAFERRIAPFYDTTGLDPSGEPGTIVRQERFDAGNDVGSAYRVLYRSRTADGTPTFASGMVFVPDASAPTPRPVLAWAHGTLGMGDSCAPSRRQDPVGETGMAWVDLMLRQGWVVTATDYAGLGTPGVLGYLIGDAEANDVLYAVRAARDLPTAGAGDSFGVWGHSQGGHSALFSASQASTVVPEMRLVGTAATAPAAELRELLVDQQDTAVAWAIGPEVTVAWPTVDPSLRPDDILTAAARSSYRSIAEKCVTAGAIDGLVRNALGERFFTADFTANRPWMDEVATQTAPVLPPERPLFVGESTTDTVVLPKTTASYVARACAAGSDLTQVWLADVSHVQLQTVIAPTVVGWMADRFAGRPSSSNCGQPSPGTPAG
jgi:hypothetical protein